MNTFAAKVHSNQSRSTLQKQGKGRQVFQFADNRPGTIVQRQLQEAADKSPRVKQTVQLQEMADTHSAGKDRSGTIQRLVAWAPTGSTVYAPHAVRRSQAANFNLATYRDGLRAILGGWTQIATGTPLTTRLNNLATGDTGPIMEPQDMGDSSGAVPQAYLAAQA